MKPKAFASPKRGRARFHSRPGSYRFHLSVEALP